MEEVWIWIAVINGLFTGIYVIATAGRGQKVIMSLFFLLLPLLGFCIYFLPLWVVRLQGKGTYDRDTLVKRLQIEKEQILPSVEKELDVVPVEDAMVIGSNAEKRELLLNQLKKDMNGNCQRILPAGRDKDGESAHYVAAARMEVCRRKQAELVKMKEAWEKDCLDDQKLFCYLSKLKDYMESKLLSSKEEEIYKAEYCELVEHMRKEGSNHVSPEEYSTALTYLVDLGRWEQAEGIWRTLASGDKNERAYQVMLKLYFDQKEEEKFYACLEELKQSKLLLSAEQIKLVRYWTERSQTSDVIS